MVSASWCPHSSGHENIRRGLRALYGNGTPDRVTKRPASSPEQSGSWIRWAAIMRCRRFAPTRGAGAESEDTVAGMLEAFSDVEPFRAKSAVGCGRRGCRRSHHFVGVVATDMLQPGYEQGVMHLPPLAKLLRSGVHQRAGAPPDLLDTKALHTKTSRGFAGQALCSGCPTKILTGNIGSAPCPRARVKHHMTTVAYFPQCVQTVWTAKFPSGALH